jgi:enoyl-[acyl-carrier protein] reductase III
VVMKKHPGKRLTTPDDVGRAIVALSAPGMNWVTGNTITIDGGEQIAGG